MPLGKSCLFVHIPKCGGTSLEVAFGIADAYPDLGLAPSETRPDFARLFGAGLQHLSIREINTNYAAITTSPDLYRFAVIRDPVDRFVSGFVWRHFRFTENVAVDSAVMRMFAADLRDTVGLSHANTLFDCPYDGLLYREDDRCSPHPNDAVRHLLPQCCYIYDAGSISLDSIFLLEDMSRIADLLPAECRPDKPVPRRMSAAMSRELRRRISPNAEFLIRSVYRHDERLVAAVRSSRGRDAAPAPRSVRSLDVPKLHSVRPPRMPKTVPRRIWTLWYQGLDDAPALVKQCIASWTVRNPGWEVVVLDRQAIAEFIALPDYLDELNLPLPAFSDVLRIHLLRKYGGVWADATTWCARPLDDWIDDATRPAGFFAYDRPGVGRPLASWFLAAAEHNPIVERWAAKVDEMWRARAGRSSVAAEPPPDDDPESTAYFWLHRLFADLIAEEADVERMWRAVPRISADGPHYLRQQGFLEPAGDSTKFHVYNRLANLYKLDRRVELPSTLGATVIGLLFEQFGAAAYRHLGPETVPSAGDSGGRQRREGQ
jgi:hypothetical protein